MLRFPILLIGILLFFSCEQEKPKQTVVGPNLSIAIQTNNAAYIDSIWQVIPAKTAEDYLLYADYINREYTKNNEAIALYTKSHELNPTSGIPLKRIGNIYIRYERLEEALNYLKQASAIQPSDHEALTNIANIHFVRQDFSEALTYYTKAIEINPNETAYYNRALCYDQLGNATMAQSDYEKSLTFKQP